MSDTPKGLQKHVNAVMQFGRTWRLEVEMEREELPRLDPYTCLGVEFPKDCEWDVHIKKVIDEGKSRVGKLPPIRAYRYLDKHIKTEKMESVIIQMKPARGMLGYF